MLMKVRWYHGIHENSEEEEEEEEKEEVENRTSTQDTVVAVDA